MLLDPRGPRLELLRTLPPLSKTPATPRPCCRRCPPLHVAGPICPSSLGPSTSAFPLQLLIFLSISPHLCVYSICDDKGAYLGVTMICSLASISYVFAKATVVFGFGAATASAADLWRRQNSDRKDEMVAVEALFMGSVSLAVSHIVSAYRTSCRER